MRPRSSRTHCAISPSFYVMRSDPPGDVAPFDAVLPVLPGIVKLHVSAVLTEIPPAVEVNLISRKSVPLLVVSGAPLARSPETHSSHGKGITAYHTESEAQRPTLLLSVTRDLHTGLYSLLAVTAFVRTLTCSRGIAPN